jgi:hypothetical protein
MNKSERGQAVVIFVLALTGLLLFTSLAVDGGMLFFQRRNAQTAADSAALAGGYAATRNLDWNATARARASANGFNNDGVTNWVTVTYPYTPPNTTGSNYIQVLIRARVRTNFIQLVFPDLVETTSESVVKITPPGPVGGDNAMTGVSLSDCDTVVVHDPASVTVNGGNIFSNSTANSQSCEAMEKQGSTNVLHVTGGNILVAGGYDSAHQYLNVSPMPTPGVPQMSALLFSPPSCTTGSNFPSGNTSNRGNVPVTNSVTLVPGIYNNITLSDASDALTLQSGLYCITGDFTATDGQIDANRVIIVMLGGSLNLSGSASVTLSALPSPANFVSMDGSTWNYGGLLIFADPNRYTGSSDTKGIHIGGSNGNQYTGTVYAPNTTCEFNGSSGTLTLNSQVYCYTVNLSGSANLQFNFNTNQNWPVPPQLELSH